MLKVSGCWAFKLLLLLEGAELSALAVAVTDVAVAAVSEGMSQAVSFVSVFLKRQQESN